MMYQITTENGVIGYAEAVDYCYKLPSGSAQVIGSKERGQGAVATGLVYGGTVYNLPDHNDFDGAETASAQKIDAAVVLNAQAAEIAARKAEETDLDAMAVDHELRLAMLEIGGDI